MLQARLEAEGSNVWVGPSAGSDVAAAYGSEWKTLGLYDRAEWEEANVALFPFTAKLLADGGCGAPLVEALFAKMPAGSRIQAHSDMSNFVLTAHLGVCGGSVPHYDNSSDLLSYPPSLFRSLPRVSRLRRGRARRLLAPGRLAAPQLGQRPSPRL